MNTSTNLPLALFSALRGRLFTRVIDDYSRNEPVQLRGWTLLALSLYLSTKIRKYQDFRIGVALPPGIAGILGNLAVLFAGKVPVNLNLTVSRDSMVASLKEAEIKVILSAGKVRAKFPDFPWTDDFIDLGTSIQSEKSRKVALLFLAIQLVFLPLKIRKRFGLNQIAKNRKEAVLLFTSGSSSQPKGVVLSDQNILSNCGQMNSLGLFKKDMKILGNLPLFHSFGLSVGTFFPLLHNLRIISAPSPLDYKSSIRAIRRGKAEVVLGTPTFLKGYLKKGKPNDFKSVRYVVAGAEKSPSDLIKSWECEHGCEYLEGYGLTETSPGLSFNLPGKGKKEGSVGKLMMGIEGRTIQPESGSILQENEPGILCFRGPNIFKGYLNDPEKTNSVLSDDGWFITGDLGRIDNDGFLFIEGRSSRFSKVGGEMVSHELVEEAVTKILSEEQHVDALTVAVTGISDKLKGECLVLLLLQEIDKKWLADQLRETGLPNLWIPKKHIVVEEIPVLGSGKLDLRKINQLAALG